MTRRVALAFLAHPDDAEILCAGALARLREIEIAWLVIPASMTGAKVPRPIKLSDARDQFRRFRIASASA